MESVPAQGTYRESANECINKWNDKSMFMFLSLSPPHSLSKKLIKFLKKIQTNITQGFTETEFSLVEKKENLNNIHRVQYIIVKCSDRNMPRIP